MALQIVLRDRPGFSISARPAEKQNLGAVVFGTDQGMCGPLNETIVSFSLDAIERLDIRDDQCHFIAVGMRAANRLEDEGRRAQKTFAVPGSVEALTPLVQELVLEIEQWLDRYGVEHVHLFHCTPQSGAAYEPRRVRLLPVDRQWLQSIREKPWPGNQLPWYSMDWGPLFAALIRQYLFIYLYRSAAESLAAENASRLAAMQGAESSIEDRLDALQGQYHQQRQMSITEELLDIVSGFEALRTDS
jgi:F-type H+-transporting ATPase subunit gamma